MAEPTTSLPWRCFHCEEVFTDPAAAALHFGTRLEHQPGCQIDLAEYRRMEALEARYAEEDADVHRAMHRQQSEHQQELRRAEEEGYAKGLAAARDPQQAPPVPMLLFCPKCRVQHVDAVEGDAWTNPPHRSHLCHACGHIWRPADLPTVGIAELATKGTNDGSANPLFAVTDESMRLPSRYQFGDEVRVRGERGTVRAVSFLLLEDGVAKVAYDVLTRHGLQPRVFSDDVGPAYAGHLRPVEKQG